MLREFGSKSTLGDQVDGLISVRDDIAVALERRAPVVALESTVIAHGLPRAAESGDSAEDGSSRARGRGDAGHNRDS